MPDITIRGAGIFGLSIAWECAKRGARVQLVDPFGAGAGSSGGVVGALAPHVPENWNEKKAFQFESLVAAELFWADVEDAGGVKSGYGRTGRLQPVADDRALELAQTRAENAQALWKGLATWDLIQVADLGSWAPRSATGWLIHDTLSARLHPRLACEALVAALQRFGVTVVPDGEASGSVIWATGVAGLEALNSENRQQVGCGVKGQAALLRPAERISLNAPQLFVDAVHVIPHSDGTVAVGSTSERDYTDPASTDSQLDEIIARAQAQVHSLADATVVQRWAGIRPRARSRAPMVGEWPGKPGHFVANGGFKIGFGMAPRVAGIMADLVLDGHDAIPDGFRVEASY